MNNRTKSETTEEEETVSDWFKLQIKQVKHKHSGGFSAPHGRPRLQEQNNKVCCRKPPYMRPKLDSLSFGTT